MVRKLTRNHLRRISERFLHSARNDRHRHTLRRFTLIRRCATTFPLKGEIGGEVPASAGTTGKGTHKGCPYTKPREDSAR